MKMIAISRLHPHPKNPRLAPREDVIEQIAAQINGGFDPAHALIVRKNSEDYEIISGHHRMLAAQKAGLTEIPCWVRDMSDEDAYMALALNNAQGELHPLEEGMHALGSGMDVRTYAEKVGKAKSSMGDRISAASVAQACPDIRTSDLAAQWSALAAIHLAPRWLWRALVSRLVAEGWTVDTARREAQKLKEVTEPPEWTDREKIAERVVSGEIKPNEVKQFAQKLEIAERNLNHGKDDSERLAADLRNRLSSKHPSLLSEVATLCNAVEQEQQALVRERQQQDFLRTKRDEEVRARTSRLRRNVSLEEWKTLANDEREALLRLSSDDEAPGTFNAQDNDQIEWAQWSWNPVTGCLHNCPYCYARDIALSTRMKKVYPNGFEPTFRPSAVLAPRMMKVPKEADTDTRYRNVFTCSMADLFGRWVPKEWIESVLREIRAAPQWNFLCLTKFPKRMAEFDIPDNAWMGTTVDLQVRVPAAEAAFGKIKAGVRWLSIEPMLEPLKFKNLDRFDWVVIGGSSRSSKTPEWCPPFEWIEDLLWQARNAGCKVYFKTNIGITKRLKELPFSAPIPSDNVPSPKEFSYIGNIKERSNVE